MAVTLANPRGPVAPDTYHGGMSVLPASVRLALWATASFADRSRLEDVLSRALPDVDHVDGDPLARLGLWRDLGERAVLVALPRPGDLRGMPSGSAEFAAAATTAGECVYVPGMGGALVPRVEVYGPEVDQGTRVTWTAYDTDPVPVHALEALSLAEVERELRSELAELTEALDGLDARPWSGSDLRATADERLGGRGWGLPDGLSPRCIRVMTMAAQVGTITDVGLSHVGHAVDSHGTERRRALLTDLQGVADRALAQAATVAALGLAGMRPAGARD